MIDLTGDDDDALTSAPARSAADALASAPAPGPARSAAPSTNETDAPSSSLKRKAPAAGVEIVVGGDLLNAEEPYVAHQGNCESRGARGLAKALFAKWPAADVYKDRRGHSTPGSVEPRDAGGKVVVALFAQRSPGLPRRDGDDSAAARLGWFEAGQHKRAKFPTSKAHISALFHSFRLIFGRAIISRSALEA